MSLIFHQTNSLELVVSEINVLKYLSISTLLASPPLLIASLRPFTKILHRPPPDEKVGSDGLSFHHSIYNASSGPAALQEIRLDGSAAFFLQIRTEENKIKILRPSAFSHVPFQISTAHFPVTTVFPRHFSIDCREYSSKLVSLKRLKGSRVYFKRGTTFAPRQRKPSTYLTVLNRVSPLFRAFNAAQTHMHARKLARS